MNEQSVKQFSSDEIEEESCCLRCRERPQCRGQCRRVLKGLVNRLPIFDALNDLTYDSAQRMVGG